MDDDLAPGASYAPAAPASRLLWLSRMRQVVLVVCIAAGVGSAACATTRLVETEHLARVSRMTEAAPRTMSTAEHHASRFDPRTWLRLYDRAHAATDWLSAAQVRVDDERVYAPIKIDVIDDARAITIRGLGRDELDDLRDARPSAAPYLVIDGDSARIEATGADLRAWIDTFIDAVAERHYPAGGVEGRDPRAYLRWSVVGGRPLGRWTIELARHAPIEVSGRLIFDRLSYGLVAWQAWAWRDVSYAEVSNLSGGKTAGAILAATVATVVTGGLDLVIGPPQDPGTWNGTPAPHARDAALLFDASTRRRSTVQVVTQTELAIDAARAAQVHAGITVMARLAQAVDLGLGVGHVQVREPVAADGRFAYVRIGAHLPLDARHRWALPMSIDLGGSFGGKLQQISRARIGVQRRVGERGYVGATVVPTGQRWRESTEPRPAVGLISVGLEGAFAF